MAKISSCLRMFEAPSMLRLFAICASSLIFLRLEHLDVETLVSARSLFFCLNLVVRRSQFSVLQRRSKPSPLTRRRRSGRLRYGRGGCWSGPSGRSRRPARSVLSVWVSRLAQDVGARRCYPAPRRSRAVPWKLANAKVNDLYDVKGTFDDARCCSGVAGFILSRIRRTRAPARGKAGIHPYRPPCHAVGIFGA